MKLNNVSHIGIIGSGMMGTSMAALFTGNGYKTTILAIDDKEVVSGRERYNTFYADLVEEGLVTPKQAKICADLLKFTLNYDDIADVDFIFECVFEDINIKFDVFEQIERHCKNFKVLASCTSAISADDLSKGVNQKEKLLVAHPWNPPHLVPCVEVVKSVYTSDETVKSLVELLESVHRQPAIMKKAAPGFIANRLQHSLVREAIYMVEKGIAEPEDIDRALTYSFIPRYTSVGLFQHQDYCGLDMVLSIDDYLFPSLCTAQKGQDYIRNLCDKGELGVKTGKGIYDWSKVDLNAYRKRVGAPYLRFFNWDLPETD